MHEVLLSRPFMSSLGLDLDKHLSDAPVKYHDAEFSRIGFLSEMHPSGELPPSRPSCLAHLFLNPLPQLEATQQVEDIFNPSEAANDAESLSKETGNVDEITGY